jgi:hypothetical protein
MKIQKVTLNEDEAQVELRARGKTYPFPYDQLSPRPTNENPIKKIYVDPQLAKEAVTYVLRSGEKGAVHIEHAIQYGQQHRT